MKYLILMKIVVLNKLNRSIINYLKFFILINKNYQTTKLQKSNSKKLIMPINVYQPHLTNVFLILLIMRVC